MSRKAWPPPGVTYVPVLKWKNYEQHALKDLVADVRDLVLPLLEVPERFARPKPPDPRSKKFRDTRAQFVVELLRCWPEGKEIFVDLDDEGMAAVFDPAEPLFDDARRKGLALTPVVTLRKPEQFVRSLAAVVATDKRGACLRVARSDLDAADFPAQVTRLLGALALMPADVDLVLDYGELSDDPLDLLAGDAVLSLNTIASAGQWRTLTLLSTAFPASLSAIERRTTGTLPRRDWHLYRQVLADPTLQRAPQFGDYGVQNPDLPEDDAYFGNISPALRYTWTDDWVIVRGKQLEKSVPQYGTLCRKLIKHPCFQGADHCAGDDLIYDRARDRIDREGLGAWRQPSTAHHITFVVIQLAKFRESSGIRERETGADPAATH